MARTFYQIKLRLYRSMLKVFGKYQMMSNCYFMVYIGILSIQDYKVHWNSGGYTGFLMLGQLILCTCIHKIL